MTEATTDTASPDRSPDRTLDRSDRPITSVGALLDRLAAAAAGDRTPVQAVLESLGRASFAPVLMAPALAVTSPLSGIPLFSSVSGLVIALVAIQLLFGRDHLWLPGWITRRTVPTERYCAALDWLDRPARWIDRHTGKRLAVLVSPPFDRVIYLLAALAGLAMPFLEIVPFSSSILGAAVSLLALTLVVRDGLLALAGFAVLTLAATALYLAL